MRFIPCPVKGLTDTFLNACLGLCAVTYYGPPARPKLCHSERHKPRTEMN